MRPFLLWCSALALLVTAPLGASAQDIEKGREIAETYCSGCHDVGPGGKMKQDPPAFAAIAAYRTPEQIRLRIIAPHAPMPKVIFTWQWLVSEVSVDDVVAYIASLENTAE
jgi:mono/diheme cytochrome c family protein